MSIDAQIDIRGVKDVIRRLYQFSDRLGDRVTLLALRSGANFMLKKVRQAAPIKTGRLRKAIRVSTSKIHTRRRDGIVGVYITIKKGKKRDDPKGAYYGLFVERGYVAGKQGKTLASRIERRRIFAHRKVQGKKFIENTFHANKIPAAELVIANIERAGDQLANQMGF